MKKCPTCQEEFADKFGFCPVDGTPLSNGFHAAREAEPVATATSVTGGAANNYVHDGESEATAEVVRDPQTANAGASNNSGGNGYHVSSVSATAAGAAAAVANDAASASGREEFHLTFLNEESLVSRLTTEIREVAHSSQLTWPEFKRDPVGFVRRGAGAYGKAGKGFFSQPNVAYGVMAALAIMIAGAIFFVMLDRMHGRDLAANDPLREDLEYVGPVTDIPEEQKKPDEGTAGNAKGKGGGSKVKQEKPGGGGGGGRQEAKPASAGKLPPASLDIPQVRAPDPRPPTVKNPNLPVPATIVADPTLFPTDTRPIAYGDPKSKSTETSSGGGKGNGIGEGTGGGVGTGEGGGVGPGRGGNTGGGDRNDGGGGAGGNLGGTDYTKNFAAKDVTRKANIIAKPEPGYTEEARKNNVTGEVLLRVVLSSNGTVTGVSVKKGLPDGLTEKAIAAAKQIKFTPAEKDGRKVSQYTTLAYSFNIY